VTHARPAPVARALDRAVTGVAVRVVAIDRADAAELAREGILPGSVVTVASRTPLGGPIVVRLGRSRLAIAAAIAARVTVERLEAAEPDGPMDMGEGAPMGRVR
jgi:Fe2+ transport system protein FeoA